MGKGRSRGWRGGGGVGGGQWEAVFIKELFSLGLFSLRRKKPILVPEATSY